MSFSPENVYFFQQRRRRRIQRHKKQLHELPQALRYTNLNPKIAAFLANKEKEEEVGRSQDDSGRTHGSKSSAGSQPVVELIVPPLKPAHHARAESAALAEVDVKAHHAQHIHTPDPDEWDLQRLNYDELRRSSPSILSRLSRLLESRQQKSQTNIPRFLAYQLDSNWRELTADAYHEPREWQTSACKDAARLRQLEEEKRRRDLASNASGESGTTAANHHADGAGEAGSNAAPETRRTKKRNGDADAESAAAGVAEAAGAGAGKKGDATLAPRRGSRSSIVSTSRPAMPRGPLASSARSAGGGATNRLSVAARRASSSLRVPGTQRSSASGADDLLSERTSLGGGTSKMSLMQEPSRGYYQTTIQFLLSSKECDEKGWIKYEDGRSPVELILQWARIRLNTAIKAKKEIDRLEQERNSCVPASVLLYGQAAANTGLLSSRRRPHTTPAASQTALPCLLTSASVSNFRQPSYAAYLAPIPPVPDWQANPDRKVWRAISNNGTTSIFYPNGSLAVLVSHAGPSKKGFFLHAYDVSPSDNAKETGRMLVTFTPYGRGTCYHSNGVLWFVAFEKGISLHDNRGSRLRKYRWPAPTSKLPSSVILRLNEHLTFRCWSRSEMSLVFAADSSSVTFDLGVDHEAIESHSKEVEELTFLISGIPFTSHTAKELIKPSGKKKQRRPPKKMDRYKLQLAELQKSMDMDSHLYESTMDKELAKVQLKMKRLCDDWLEHYRLCLGILPPNLGSVEKLTAKHRLIKSAHPPHDHEAAVLRTKSAPLWRRPVTASTVAGATVTFEETPREEGRPCTAMDGANETAGAEAADPRMSPSVSFGKDSYMQYADLMQPVPCPVVCRALMMGLETVGCRCSRTKIPTITDLEYEYFLQRVIPREQLVIIGIVSSSAYFSPPCISVLDALYERMNRNRPHPCGLSRHDEYRIFLYDLAHAAKTTPCTQALLLRRHNVVPGMCLMYQAGRLLFADQIFNGYSITRKDITKQIKQCRVQAMQGFSLPIDFRFQAPPKRLTFGARRDGKEHHVTLLLDGEESTSTSSLPLAEGQQLRSSMGASIVAYY